MRGARRLLLFFMMVGLASCEQVSTKEAHRLVERYNQIVCEAYRRGDVTLIDSVVGPNTTAGRKLTGLIGVRLDMGIILDPELLSLDVTAVRQEGGMLQVQTKERWRYRDLEIGTGRQVGEESLDSYELLYVFKKIDNAWFIEETRFTAPPQVGRKVTPWSADRRIVHGFTPAITEKKGKNP